MKSLLDYWRFAINVEAEGNLMDREIASGIPVAEALSDYAINVQTWYDIYRVAVDCPSNLDDTRSTPSA